MEIHQLMSVLFVILIVHNVLIVQQIVQNVLLLQLNITIYKLVFNACYLQTVQLEHILNLKISPALHVTLIVANAQ
jgi:hypothetical protein